MWRGLATALRFFGAARRYWLSVFPRVNGELAAWHRRAATVPDPVVRSLALEAERKRGNMEGSAIFAAFAPARHRGDAIAAAVRFQSAYNYVDLLGEQRCEKPRLNGYRLHEALLAALRPGASHPDYYEYLAPHAAADARHLTPHAVDGAGRLPALVDDARHLTPHAVDDAGYLEDLVSGCRRALVRLPSHAAVSDAALRSAERVIAFQALNSGHEELGHAPLAGWGGGMIPRGSGLTWWEAAAAAGSSLGVFVLISAAARPALGEAEVEALDAAYFPWIGGLHSLLDNVVDTDEDAVTGQLSLLSHYASRSVASERMGALAARSIAAARELPSSFVHVLALGAMAGFYLSEREAGGDGVRAIRDRVRAELGLPADLAVVVFRVRRCIGTVNRRVRRGGSLRTADMRGSQPIAAFGERTGVTARDRAQSALPVVGSPRSGGALSFAPLRGAAPAAEVEQVASHA